MDDVQWRIDIATSTYTGSPIPVRGTGQAGVLSYAGDTDDPFSVYIKSTLEINVNNEGQINGDELGQAQDKDFIATLYRENIQKWTGYIDPGSVQEPMKSYPYAFTFNAIDGLSMLTDIPYVHADLPGTDNNTSRCPMNYIRQILFANLGIVSPIRWTNLLQCTAFLNQDVFVGSVRWSQRGEGFLSYQSGQDGDSPGPAQSCDYILTGILQSMQCRIYQADGRWNIRRIPDIVSRNVIPYSQISGDVGVMIVMSGTENILSQIGRSGFGFLNTDAIKTNKPGIKSCTVTYTANVRQNILPNGNQDLIYYPEIVVRPLYWDILGGEAIPEPGSLDGRTGYATEVIGENTLVPQFYSMQPIVGTDQKINGLPIDAYTMIKYINFGFTLEVISGYPTQGSTDIIDWTSNPLQIQVVFNNEGTQYFLNKFGYWQVSEVLIPIVIDNLQVNDVAKVDFNAFQNIILPQPMTQPIAGSVCDIQVLFRFLNAQSLKLDNIYVNFAGGNDVYQSTLATSRNTSVDTRSLNISSSFGGYQLSNFMTSPFNSDEECFFQDGEVYTGTLTGLTANAIMRFRYKSSRIFNGSISTLGRDWSFDSLFLIDSMNTAKFMPINASYNTEKCQVNNLVAIESRNDFVSLTETYYSNNDLQLSN